MKSIFLNVALAESVKDSVGSILGKSLRFYQHMVKWRYYRNDTEEKYTSWINTILEAHKTIKNKAFSSKGDPYTNIIKRSNSELYKVYVSGCHEASKELNRNFLKTDEDSTFNDFPDIQSICDINYLKKWLLKYANTDRDKDMVNNAFIN